MADSDKELIIRTSQPAWFKQLVKAYKDRTRVTVVDDADIGIDLSVQSLLDVGIKAGLSRREWMAVLVSLGLSAVGVWMILAALADPEPTSKLWCS